MQLHRLPTINLVSKSDVNNSCIQENCALPRFYYQPTLCLDSNLPYHVIDQQNSVGTPELPSFPPYTSELYRHFTTYHHPPQFSARVDTQTPTSGNGIQISEPPPTSTVPVMTPEENSNGLRCFPRMSPSSSFPLLCQNNSFFNSNHLSMDNSRLPHNMCNLGIINLHQQHSDLQQLECNKSNVELPDASKQDEHLKENTATSTKSLENENSESQKVNNELNQNVGSVKTHEEVIDDGNGEINPQLEDSNDSVGNVTIKQKRVVFCKICRKGYGSQESLETHMRSHGPHKCPMCSKIFSRQCNLKIHMAVHAERTCLCKDCGKSFKSANALQAHANTVHTNSDLNSVICESCGIVLKNRKSLLQHEQIHTRGKRFACDLCNERFNRKDALNRHVVRIHVEEKFFTCQTCNIHFNTNESLQEHLWTHETERPHQCQLCQRRFPQRSALERHIKIHSDQRSFSCGVCGLSFTRSYRLKAHLQSHLGT